MAGGAALSEKITGGTPRAVMAFAADGKSLELTDKVQNGKLNWQAPAGKWTVYALLQSPPIQKVKRAAPGGDGWVVDPFSVKSLAGYLARFDAAFKGFKGAMPRAQFHDSFEYFGADFTPELFAQFQKRHGYDLKMQLPALLGEGPAETATRECLSRARP